MIIYYFLILFWAFSYILMKHIIKESHKFRKMYSVVSGVALFLVMSLRDTSVGADTKQYLYRYNYINTDLTIDIFSKEEWGFELFNAALRLFNFSNQGYIFVTAAIISFCFSLFIYRYSKNIFMSFFLHLTIGLFTMSLSGLRQTLAICIILIAFQFAFERKPVKYFFSILVAYTIHSSAIVFLPVYLLRNIRVSKKKGIILLSLLIVSLIIRKQFSYLVEFLMPGRYALKYDVLSVLNPINPVLVLIGFLIPFACLVLWGVTNKFNINNKKLISFLFVLSCMHAFANILALNSSMIGRLAFYFVPFNIILIPNIISGIKDKRLRVIALFLAIVLPLIQFVMSTPGGTLRIDQYNFFW